MSSDHVKIAFSGNRGVSQGRGNAGSVSVRIFTSAPVLSLLQPRTGASSALGKHSRKRRGFKPGHVLLCDFCLFKLAMIGTSSTMLLHHGEFLPPLHLPWLTAVLRAPPAQADPAQSCLSHRSSAVFLQTTTQLKKHSGSIHHRAHT